MGGVRRCPVCGKPAEPRRKGISYPFCSGRCRLVDLGKWLGEDYRIPGARPGDGAEKPPGEEESDA